MRNRASATIRRAFAEELRVAGPVRRNARILDAFAAVRREKYLGPGPWTIHGTKPYRTPDADPAWLYHNVLVAIDLRKGLNNGMPAFWAYLLDQAEIAPGERVYQVGAGTGYYTAILAHLVGPKGHVRAVEYEKRLARAAAANLAELSNVEVIHGDGGKIDPGAVDVIVAFTGGTHPPAAWLERLRPGGRLLMPLVSDRQWGFMLLAVKDHTPKGRPPKTRTSFRARALSVAGFYLAKGFRDRRAARAIAKLMDKAKGKPPKFRRLHVGPVPAAKQKTAMYTAPGIWLS